MADDGSWNSAQAQLGLVSQGGSFNPLGIATPAPPPAPMVRHPGEISQDIVRQTQTAMATTLQTTSAMRMGGMGGMAFGGGNGMGAIGAFSQQYQQNMAGINAQHLNPFSAQMMGVMGGMGGGFNTGMMPNPAMMTTPGMGIYRPFMPPQSPTVSPFPQMPMFPTPFTPMPPPAMFQTPMELSNNISIQAGQRRTAAMFAMPGVAARAATDIGMGYMGAGAGAALGARFGPMGAAIGGGLGLAAGMFGSEHFGLGATAQHMTNNLNPFRTMAIRGQQMMSASQDWVTGGSDLNGVSGRGLSSRGATHLGRMLEDTAYNSRFRRETGSAFSAQDLTRITNVAGQQGMLNDAQSVDQIHDRVKGIAKSLVSFMKIANEPNVVEALKSMGKMRAMGLSMSETMDAAVDARMFSRMAGTTTSGLMSAGGMPGAMLFQQQGLSAGLGMRVGMGALGMANAAVAGGAFSQQRLAMLGGVQGVAQHEMESSAAFLKMPMMAAAMSRMGAGGTFGVDGGAIKALSLGGMNISQMASRGANNLLDAVGKQGIGALGMMQVQGSEIQDSIGRLLGPQGLQAAKMQQVMQTMGLMGLNKNPGGFATAGLAMGMSNDQVKSMMSQANSPGYWQNLQSQNRIQQMEVRGLESERIERGRPGFFGRLTRDSSNTGLNEAYRGFRNFGEGVTDFFATDEEGNQARARGQVVLRTGRNLLSDARATRRGQALSAGDYAGAKDFILGSGGRRSRNEGILGSQNYWDSWLGGDADNLAQQRQAEGGLRGVFGGGMVERGARLALGKTAGDFYFGSETGNNARRADLQAGADMWAGGAGLQGEDITSRAASVAKRTGWSEKEVAGLASRVSLDLGKQARADRKVIGNDTVMGGAATESKIREMAKAMGKDPNKLSKEDITTIGEMITETAGAMSGGSTAFRGVDFVNVKDHKEFVDKLQGSQDELTSALFGKEGVGVDLFRGTRDERVDMMKTLFAGGESPEAAALASLAEAASTGSESAQAEYLKAADSASQSVKDEANAIQKRMGAKGKSYSAGLGKIGQRGATLDAKTRVEAMNSIRATSDSYGRMLTERSGRRHTFGEGSDATAPISAILSGDTRGMGARGKALADRYKTAKGNGDKEEMAAIEREAQGEVMSTGYATESETAGGSRGVFDKAFDAVSGMLGKTGSDVSSAFPNAVNTFDEASRAMLKAANMLSGKHTLPDDMNWNPYGQ